MKEKELRIGNYVYFQDALLKFDFESGWNFDYIKPIPLTEQWLLKFGFKAWDNKKTIYTIERDIDEYNNTCFRFWFKQDELIFDYIQNETHPTESVFDDKNIIRLKIQHVHQLQNLYFALTNEEL